MDLEGEARPDMAYGGGNGGDSAPLGDPAAAAPPEQAKWMVCISFPRRLLNQMGANLDWYEGEIDRDDVEAAKDSGIDSESAYQTDEQQPDMDTAGTPGGPRGAGDQAEEFPDAP